MLHDVLHLEKRKNIHSVVKERRKLRFQLNLAQGEIDINIKTTKTALKT